MRFIKALVLVLINFNEAKKDIILHNRLKKKYDDYKDVILLFL